MEYTGGPDIKRAYIILYNVAIERLKDDRFDDMFILHDDSGEGFVYWGRGVADCLDARVSFEEAQQTQGLEDGDWIYQVVLSHILPPDKFNYPVVFSVKKNKSSDIKPIDKLSILEWINSHIDRIGDYIPGYPPAPQPAPY